MKTRAIFPQVVLVGVLVCLFQIRDFTYRGRAFPFVAGTPLVALLVIDIVREVSARKKVEAPSAATAPAAEETKISSRSLLKAAMWVIVFLADILLLGFEIGLPLYLFGYMKSHKVGWITSIACAVAIFALLYLFTTKLQLEFYPGFIPGMFD